MIHDMEQGIPQEGVSHHVVASCLSELHESATAMHCRLCYVVMRSGMHARRASQAGQDWRDNMSKLLALALGALSGGYLRNSEMWMGSGVCLTGASWLGQLGSMCRAGSPHQQARWTKQFAIQAGCRCKFNRLLIT